MKNIMYNPIKILREQLGDELFFYTESMIAPFSFISLAERKGLRIIPGSQQGIVTFCDILESISESYHFPAVIREWKNNTLEPIAVEYGYWSTKESTSGDFEPYCNDPETYVPISNTDSVYEALLWSTQLFLEYVL